MTDVDPGDNEHMSTLVISLLQKYTREKRIHNNGESCEEFIQFRLYRIINEKDAEQAKRTGQRLYASQLERCGTSGPYINLREITKRFRTAPGSYLIMPSCYDAGISGEFLLRLYTENPINEGNCSILHDHKDDLKQEDIFFSYPKSLDNAFSSWNNLLKSGSNTDISRTSSASSFTRTPSSNYELNRVSKNGSQVNLTTNSYVKEFKLYINDSLKGLHEKVDVRKKTKRF